MANTHLPFNSTAFIYMHYPTWRSQLWQGKNSGKHLLDNDKKKKQAMPTGHSDCLVGCSVPFPGVELGDGGLTRSSMVTKNINIQVRENYNPSLQSLGHQSNQITHANIGRYFHSFKVYFISSSFFDGT